MSYTACEQEIEDQCLADYQQHAGKTILTTYLRGIVDHDTVDFYPEKPVLVRVVEYLKTNDICNWTGEGWCDPNWDVELLSPHKEMEMASSLWIEGISRNVDGTTSPPNGWDIDSLPDNDISDAFCDDTSHNRDTDGFCIGCGKPAGEKFL